MERGPAVFTFSPGIGVGSGSQEVLYSGGVALLCGIVEGRDAGICRDGEAMNSMTAMVCVSGYGKRAGREVILLAMMSWWSGPSPVPCDQVRSRRR